MTKEGQWFLAGFPIEAGQVPAALAFFKKLGAPVEKVYLRAHVETKVTELKRATKVAMKEGVTDFVFSSWRVPGKPPYLWVDRGQEFLKCAKLTIRCMVRTKLIEPVLGSG